MANLREYGTLPGVTREIIQNSAIGFIERHLSLSFDALVVGVSEKQIDICWTKKHEYFHEITELSYSQFLKLRNLLISFPTDLEVASSDTAVLGGNQFEIFEHAETLVSTTIQALSSESFERFESWLSELCQFDFGISRSRDTLDLFFLREYCEILPANAIQRYEPDVCLGELNAPVRVLNVAKRLGAETIADCRSLSFNQLAQLVSEKTDDAEMLVEAFVNELGKYGVELRI